MRPVNNRFSSEVDALLNKLEHPLRREIDYLRALILNAEPRLEENIKWNVPNYTINNHDRLTLRILPPKKLQIIFHRGARKVAEPPTQIINDTSGLLRWITNDRAVASFITMDDIIAQEQSLHNVVKKWLAI